MLFSLSTFLSAFLSTTNTTQGTSEPYSITHCMKRYFTNISFKDVLFQGRSQKVSVRETIKLGRVRSVSFRLKSDCDSSFFQAKLLCPGTSSKFAWAGSTLVSLISGIGLTLVVALLAYLGLVLRRGWSKRISGDQVDDLEQDASGDEVERLQNVHLESEEMVRGRSKTNLDLGGEEETEEGLQGDQLDIGDRQGSKD